MKEKDLKEQIWLAIEGILARKGYEIVGIEWRREQRGWVLRIFIDKLGGVTVEDCAKVSEIVGKVLDEEDFIHHPYTLEISSPGIERPLYREKDFERFKGEPVQIILKTPLFERRKFKGLLLGLIGGKVRIELENGERVDIELENIKKATLKPEITF